MHQVRGQLHVQIVLRELIQQVPVKQVHVQLHVLLKPQIVQHALQVMVHVLDVLQIIRYRVQVAY